MWVKRIFRLLPDLKKSIYTAIAFAFVLEALKLVPPYLMKVAIDLLIVPDPILMTVLGYIGAILVVSLMVTAVESRYTVFTFKKLFYFETQILKKAHDKLLSLGLNYYDDHQSGSLVYLMNRGASRLADLIWFIHERFIGLALQLVLTSIILLYVHFYAGLVFVGFLPIVLYLINKTATKVQKYRVKYHGKFREAAWEMNQSILNIRTVKDYVQEDYEKDKYGDLLRDYVSLSDVRIEVEDKETTARDIVLNVARFAILSYTVYLVVQGAMSVGTLVLFATLSEKAFASLFRLGRLYNHLGDSMESINQFSALFEEEPDIQDTEGAMDLPELKGEITFDKVSFAYNDGAPALDQIDLKIPPRKVVAVVGASGAGKTTLIKLLSRHYDVTSGALLVDGVDVRKFKVADYRRRIAVVSQNIELFDATVRDNISYGRKEASDEEIIEVAKLANAHEFIMGLPDGYDTKIGEKGIRLSGGQQQRVGIARALLMRPTVLIFDEATSSLDTESEKLIQEALSGIARKQTMFIIAHRLSTIENADLVIVLEDGKVVELGSPAELIKMKGHFARMRSLQNLGEIRA